MYTQLAASKIVETADRIRQRIVERFPGRGLGKVADELYRIAAESAATAERLKRPDLRIRTAIGAGILLLVGVAIGALVTIKARVGETASLWDVLQGIEAGINDVVFLGIGVFFLVTWERRRKRSRALKALHQLRSLAHVIDMHQLTKDPGLTIGSGGGTPSSPEPDLTIFELIRYLDYCSEMLAIVGKIAALWSETLDDSVALAAVNEIEALTAGLSQKIWQKIVIAERMS
ncbi:MAG: hypothetical protein FD129_2442 [bacterium]|nr:MAG: hypothetical protein FD129_2442 [bacterium]